MCWASSKSTASVGAAQVADPGLQCMHMSYSLNSFKGGYIGDYIGTTLGVIKGDTKSLDNDSYAIPRCLEGIGRSRLLPGPERARGKAV